MSSFNTAEYLKKELFNSDEITFRKISDLYLKLYGYGPHSYFLSTFDLWKSGKVSMARTTILKIVNCVPLFISEEKRFFILKNEIIQFMEIFHSRQIRKKVQLDNLNDLFKSYSLEIEKFNQENLPNFIGKLIFSPEEIEELLSVCKYALYRKLELSVNQVSTDLALIKSLLSPIDNKIYDGSYHVDFFNSSIKLSNINNYESGSISEVRYDFTIKGRYVDLTHKYILEELLILRFSTLKSEANNNVGSNDIILFFNKYFELKSKDVGTTLDGTFQLKGGTAIISINNKSVKELKRARIDAILKLLVYLTLLVILVLVPFNFSSKIADTIFKLEFFPILVLLSLIFYYFYNIIDFSQNITLYGKKHPTSRVKSI